MLYLEDTEIAELAHFFARRFPDPAHRAPLLVAAGLTEPIADSPQAAWISIFCQARQSPFRLSALASCARRVDLEDDNLQDICAILISSPSRFSSILAVASGIACALLVTAVVLPIFQSPSIAANPAPESTALVSAVAPPLASHASVATAATVPTSNLRIYAKDDAPAAPPAAPPAPPEEPPAAPDIAEAPAAAAPPAPDRSSDYTGRCRARDGELIGYWYAGSSSPGAAGETITASVTTNVRADYPDVHNDFDARTTVRCILLEGQQVTLSVEPKAVPGGRYWVPLYGGDLN